MADRTTLLLDQILEAVHPLMVESLYLAAVPEWFTPALFSAMRRRDDGRDEGIIERFGRYSFIERYIEDGTTTVFTVRRDERDLLQRRWLEQDPQAYRAAHERALAYWRQHPADNQFAQAQNELYHLLFVDTQAGIDFLVGRFRVYSNERHLAAIERLLTTAKYAQTYLVLLEGSPPAVLNQLLTHLQARLAQLRGQWDKSLRLLEPLWRKADLSPQLRPYVARAYGYALARTGNCAQAVEQYRLALAQFEQQMTAPDADTATIEAERAYTLIALGDAHVELAATAQGDQRPDTAEFAAISLRPIRAIFYAFLSLPLLFYLSFYLGRRVWRPRFWPVLRHLDWIIARLFATGARYYTQADSILETHGRPGDAVAADEKLAFLYLRIGDGQQAETLFRQLLAEEEAPLSIYRQARVRVGLGEALLRLKQPQAALVPLQTAVPVLRELEDREQQAEAEALLLETLAELDPAAAVEHGQQALRLFRRQDNLVGATEVAEWLMQVAQDERLTDAEQAKAQETAARVQQRRYPVRYRHPATVMFQQVILILLAAIVFLIPISVIQLETGTSTVPVISFNASPLLQSDNPDFTPELSQGVAAISLSPIPNPDVLIWLGVVLFVGYLMLSTGLGFLAIIRTTLRQVQAAGQADAVQLDGEILYVGHGEQAQTLDLSSVQRFVRADVRFWTDVMVDHSLAVLVGEKTRLVIKGSTTWYESLLAHIEERLSPTAERLNLSYRMLWSKMGAWYVASLLVLLLMAVLGEVAPDWVRQDLLTTPYSLADLYPYLYLGLFVPPLWWYLIRPLSIRRHANPRTRLPLWLGAAAVGLAVLRIITQWRPWFTVPDIYPSLAILVLLGASALALWRERDADSERSRYPVWLQALVGLVAGVVFVVAALHLGRETAAYHYLVVGHSHRDQAAAAGAGGAKQAELEAAIAAYSRAMTIADYPILGATAQDTIGVVAGIPPRRDFTWLAALNSRAAMRAQLGNFNIDVYRLAVEDYIQLLRHTNNPAQVHASIGLIYQSWGTLPGPERGETEAIDVVYERAIDNFEQAIDLAPGEAQYHLWLAVAHHALNQLDEAQEAYGAALTVTETPLTAEQASQAYIGLGWLAYGRQQYDEAGELFQKARDVNPDSADAHFGLGYVHYKRREYDKALNDWEMASELTQNNPLIPISLGTLYWRVGTLGDNYNEFGSDRCFSDAVSQAGKEKSAQQLETALEKFEQSLAMPGQEAEDIAFTYRTMAQVNFLLRHCPGYERAPVLERSIDFYDEAVALDEDNAGYWFRRGRLAYSLWENLERQEEKWLLAAIESMEQATAVAPETAVYWHDLAWINYFRWQQTPAGTGPSGREPLFIALNALEKALALDDSDRGSGYRPNYWYDRVYPQAVEGTLEQGDRRLDNGEYEVARAYYRLVAENRPENALAAFKLGMAWLALGDQARAQEWYDTGFERAAANDDERAIRMAQADLAALLERQSNLRPDATLIQRDFAATSLDFDQPIPPPEPTSATDAFEKALTAVAEGNYEIAAQLYEQGLALAAEAGNQDAALAAGNALEGYLLTNADVAITDVLWLLGQQPVERPDVDELERPDRYWRYRADFTFYFSNRLFNERVGQETLFERIYDDVIIDAIERAYELNSEAHERWYNFYRDANVGWLFLRRGDSYFEEEEYQQAFVDYREAAQRIRPDSSDARNDLLDATFKVGLTAVALEDLTTAEQWYQRGVALARQYDRSDAIERARMQLEEFLEANPESTPDEDTDLGGLYDN